MLWLWELEMFSISLNFSFAALKLSRSVFSYESQACGRTFVRGGHGKRLFDGSPCCGQWGRDSVTQQIPPSPAVLHLYKCQRGADANTLGVRGTDRELMSMQGAGLPIHSVPFFASLFVWWSSVTLESRHCWHKHRFAGIVRTLVFRHRLCPSPKCSGHWQAWSFAISMDFVWESVKNVTLTQCCWVATQGKTPLFSLTIFTSTIWSIRSIFFPRKDTPRI